MAPSRCRSARRCSAMQNVPASAARRTAHQLGPSSGAPGPLVGLRVLTLRRRSRSRRLPGRRRCSTAARCRFVARLEAEGVLMVSGRDSSGRAGSRGSRSWLEGRPPPTQASLAAEFRPGAGERSSPRRVTAALLELLRASSPPGRGGPAAAKGRAAGRSRRPGSRVEDLEQTPLCSPRRRSRPGAVSSAAAGLGPTEGAPAEAATWTPRHRPRSAIRFAPSAIYDAAPREQGTARWPRRPPRPTRPPCSAPRARCSSAWRTSRPSR